MATVAEILKRQLGVPTENLSDRDLLKLIIRVARTQGTREVGANLLSDEVERLWKIEEQVTAIDEASYDRRAMFIAEQFVELLQDHERRQHDGERCPRETFNLLAFLAHKIGVQDFGDTEEAIREWAMHVRDYQAVHEEHHA